MLTLYGFELAALMLESASHVVEGETRIWYAGRFWTPEEMVLGIAMGLRDSLARLFPDRHAYGTVDINGKLWA